MLPNETFLLFSLSVCGCFPRDVQKRLLVCARAVFCVPIQTPRWYMCLHVCRDSLPAWFWQARDSASFSSPDNQRVNMLRQKWVTWMSNWHKVFYFQWTTSLEDLYHYGFDEKEETEFLSHKPCMVFAFFIYTQSNQSLEKAFPSIDALKTYGELQSSKIILYLALFDFSPHLL